MIPHDWGDDEEEAAPRRFRGLPRALVTRRFLLTAVAIALLLVGGGVAWEGLGHDVDLYGVYDGDTLEMTPHDCLLSHIGVACPTQRMRLYGVDAKDVLYTPYPAALALKGTIPRRVSSGDVGDTDVYGAQQHAPMLDSWPTARNRRSTSRSNI